MEHPAVPGEVEHSEGGDAACWAHIICPECGAVETEGHRSGCRYEQANVRAADRAPGT